MIGLEYIRRKNGLSISTLAKRLNISRQAVSQWEHGTDLIPDKRLLELSELFGIPKRFFSEISDDDIAEIDTLLNNSQAQDEETFWISQHEAAMKAEQEAISRLDRLAKGKDLKFDSFHDAIAYINRSSSLYGLFADLVDEFGNAGFLPSILSDILTAKRKGGEDKQKVLHELNKVIMRKSDQIKEADDIQRIKNELENEVETLF